VRDGGEGARDRPQQVCKLSHNQAQYTQSLPYSCLYNSGCSLRSSGVQSLHNSCLQEVGCRTGVGHIAAAGLTPAMPAAAVLLG
jgi:hypothetical protein